MSVHAKKRIPPHKHFQTEIVEVRRVRPDRPAYKSVHASDVVVDSTLTLDETVVEWTRHWEAEDYEAKDADWTEVSDATASKGKAMKCLGSVSSGNLEFVHLHDLKIAGEISYLVRAKVSDNTIDENVLYIYIYDNDSSTYLAERYVKSNEFPTANKYHHFALKCEIPANKTNLNVGIFKQSANADLYVDYGGFLPAHFPLGYADVSVLETDTGATGDLVDTGATGDTEDPSTTTTPYALLSNTTVGYVATSVSVANETWTTLITLSPSANCELYFVHTAIRTPYATSGHGRSVRVYDETDEIYYPENDADTAFQIYLRVVSDGEIPKSTTTHVITIPRNVNGHTLRIQVWHDYGDATTIEGYVKGWGHSQHTHPVANDSHGHTVSGDSHTTPISNDAHAHSDTEGGHEH